MQIFTEITHLPKLRKPVALTIGMFDGMHLGHKALLKRLKELGSTTIVFSFGNHPDNLFKKIPLGSIGTRTHKIQLIEEEGVDILFLIPFTLEFASKSAKEFLVELQRSFGISHLILGHDAVIGKKREGTQETVKEICDELKIYVEYLPAIQDTIGPISSSRIRSLISEGKLKEASQLLGRLYSIKSFVAKGSGIGKTLGFPTANIATSGLCLPPFGVYNVTLIHNNIHYRAIANLGVRPTVDKSGVPVLETHIFNFNQNIVGEEVEVIFHQFIRPEMRFANVEALKTQILKDVDTATLLHTKR